MYFDYPGEASIQLPYLRPAVKLEPGTLTDQIPTGRAVVRPWVADRYPELFGDWRCEVVALDVRRTFWEKATILHAEYYRPDNQSLPARYARHYSDVARMVGSSDGDAHLADRDMCLRVAEWKRLTFPRAWAHYVLATHGTLRLVPDEKRIGALRDDYARMRDMFLSEPAPFAEVIATLRDAEAIINA